MHPPTPSRLQPHNREHQIHFRHADCSVCVCVCLWHTTAREEACVLRVGVSTQKVLTSFVKSGTQNGHWVEVTTPWTSRSTKSRTRLGWVSSYCQRDIQLHKRYFWCSSGFKIALWMALSGGNFRISDAVGAFVIPPGTGMVRIHVLTPPVTGRIGMQGPSVGFSVIARRYITQLPIIGSCLTSKLPSVVHTQRKRRVQ